MQPDYIMMGADSRFSANNGALLISSKMCSLSEHSGTRASICGNKFEANRLVSHTGPNARIGRRTTHKGIIKACKQFNKNVISLEGFAMFVCTGISASIIYYIVDQRHAQGCPKTYGCCGQGQSRHGVEHLDLGIHAMGSGQHYALQQLAARFLKDEEDVYYHRHLNTSEILGSYNEAIEEEKAQESVFEALFVAALKDESTGPPFEAHKITEEGQIRKTVCTFTEACIKFERIATHMLYGQTRVFLFYPQRLLPGKHWKNILTCGVLQWWRLKKVGHPLTFLKGGYVLHSVEFISDDYVSHAMRVGDVLADETLYFLDGNFDLRRLRSVKEKFLIGGVAENELICKVYYGRAEGDLIMSLREDNPQVRESFNNI